MESTEGLGGALGVLLLLGNMRKLSPVIPVIQQRPLLSSRSFFSLTVEPLADLLAAELSAKLEAEIGLSFKGWFAADLAGRARAFQSMVGAGMDPAKAAGSAGLMDAEACFWQVLELRPRLTETFSRKPGVVQ